MTIVLVILAVLILLSVLFLIRRVNQLSDSILPRMSGNYVNLVDHILALEKTITKQITTITTTIGSQHEDVVRLTNKVEECLKKCVNVTRDLKENISNLETRITAPIDKINDTHNRVKTLGKGATSADELRDIVGNVVATIAKDAVTDAVDRLTKKPKTTKKVTKKAVSETKA